MGGLHGLTSMTRTVTTTKNIGISKSGIQWKPMAGNQEKRGRRLTTNVLTSKPGSKVTDFSVILYVLPPCTPPSYPPGPPSWDRSIGDPCFYSDLILLFLNEFNTLIMRKKHLPLFCHVRVKRRFYRVRVLRFNCKSQKVWSRPFAMIEVRL